MLIIAQACYEWVSKVIQVRNNRLQDLHTALGMVFTKQKLLPEYMSSAILAQIDVIRDSDSCFEITRINIWTIWKQQLRKQV